MVAVVYAMYLFASSAPSPLYVVYQSKWHFSAGTLTVIFALYVFALLVALLFTGSVSDYIGRKPTALAASTMQIGAMVTFALAAGVGWLAVARVLQGLGTGTAVGALSAWLLDLQPASPPGLGATVSSSAPPAGLAVGAIAAGALVQYGPAPTQFVFWLLVAFFCLSLLALAVIPETVAAPKPRLSALRPRIAVAPEAREAFVSVMPSIIGNWALAGLFLSLGGSLTAAILHAQSHVIGGLVVLSLAGVGVLATLVTTRLTPRALVLAGSTALVIGLSVSVTGLHETSPALFFTGSVIAGMGYGPAWTGAFRTVASAAPVHQRAAVVAAIYLVAYLALSVPALGAGIAASHLGLLPTTTWYAGGVVVLFLVAAVAATTGGHRSASPAAMPFPTCPGTVATRTRYARSLTNSGNDGGSASASGHQPADGTMA